MLIFIIRCNQSKERADSNNHGIDDANYNGVDVDSVDSYGNNSGVLLHPITGIFFCAFILIIY